MQIVTALGAGTTQEQISAVDDLIERITVSRDYIEVLVRRSALTLTASSGEETPFVCSKQPVVFRCHVVPEKRKQRNDGSANTRAPRAFAAR